MPSERETWPSRLFRYAGWGTTFAAPILGGIAGTNDGNARWYWYTGAGAAALCTAFCAWQVQRQLTKAQKDVTALLEKIAPPLLFALQSLSMASDVHGRKEAVGELKRVVLDGARACGGEQARATLYLFEDHPPHAAGECLDRNKVAGRRDGNDPRVKFCGAQNPEDEEVVAVALGHKVRTYRDIRKTPPRGVINPKDRSYRSIMFTPVRVKAKSFGMLSVDHPRPKVFHESHLALLNLLAGSLGAAMAIDEAADATAAAVTPKRGSRSQNLRSAPTTPIP